MKSNRGQIAFVIIAIIVLVLVVGFIGYYYYNSSTNSPGSSQSGNTNDYGINTGGNSAGNEQTAPETYTVEINSDGFSPNTLEINRGDTVVWVNRDNSEHWPASANHPTHTAYPGSAASKCGTSEQDTIFDACHGLMTGESFTFNFDEVGTWSYHDHLNPASTGTIKVK